MAIDAFYFPIVYSFIRRGGVIKNLKDLYNDVQIHFGGYRCPYSNTIITKENFEGRIRSWIEERCADSRQHYFRGGKLMKSGWRANIFSNEKLGATNMENDFKPYTHARGDGWVYRPSVTNPSLVVLKVAESLYRKKGERGMKTKIAKFTCID